jgi:hypothetical protein
MEDFGHSHVDLTDFANRSKPTSEGTLGYGHDFPVDDFVNQ